MKKSTTYQMTALLVFIACLIFTYLYQPDIILVYIMVTCALSTYGLSYLAGEEDTKETLEEPVMKLANDCDYLEKEIKNLILELKNSKSGHSENDILAKRLKKILKKVSA